MERTGRGYLKGGYHFFSISDQKAQSIDYHYHTFHKCLIVQEGQVTYTVEGRRYELVAGDVLWVPSYEAHNVVIAGSHTYTRCVVYLSQAFFDMLGPDLSGHLRRVCSERGNRIIFSDEVRSRALALIPRAPIGVNINDQMEALSRFVRFIALCLEETGETDTMEVDQTVQGVKAYLKAHMDKPLSIDDVADHLFLNRYYLMHRFKEVTGMTIKQCLASLRMAKARDLMKKGLSLTEVAYAVGYGSYTSFARAFGKQYQMSPRKFQTMGPVEENL